MQRQQSDFSVAIFKSSTDESSGKDRYLTLLENHQIKVLLVPTLSFRFELDLLKSCLRKPESYSGFVLTSQRSVEAIKFACDSDGIPLDLWKTKQHFCVGLKTRDSALQLLNVTNLVGYDCGSAENLAPVIINEVKPGDLPLLFPCSNLKMETLPLLMKENRISLESVTSYVTIPHPQLEESITNLAQKKPNCLVFFSPSNVDFTKSHLTTRGLLTPTTQVVSIGKTTSAALEKSGIRVDQVCAKPTPEHLLEALQRILKTN